MRRILGIGLFSLAFAGAAAAQLDSIWARTYGGPSNDGFRSVAVTADGGFLAVGYTYSFGAGNTDLYAVRADGNGDTLWTRTYGGAGRDYGWGCAPTADGGFAIAGYTTSRGSGKEDLWLVRIDSGGDTLWTRAYGGPRDDEGRAILETPEGDLMVVGWTDVGANELDLWILRTESDGDTLWTRRYGGTGVDVGYAIARTADGFYAAVGWDGEDGGYQQALLVKVDDDGYEVCSEIYGNDHPVNYEWAMDVCALEDSGVVMSVTRGVEGSDPADAGYVQTFGDCSQRRYRANTGVYYEYGNGILRKWDGAFLVAGASKRENDHTNDLFLAERSGGAGWIYNQAIGGAGTDWAQALERISPGRYVLAGHTNSEGAGGFDAWLVLVQEQSVSVEAGEPAARSALLSAPRPNPARSSLAFSIHMARSGSVDLRVLNVAGKVVRRLHGGDLPPGTHTFEWDTRNDRGRPVSSGVYFLAAEGAVHGMRKAIVLR
ncbi:MAG: hypothetical protein JW958_07730 [Candidatus Eisenbacteria bacterium]|nr:hypothetical protein [Candidatus Eisenbacteria bacterium]